MKKYLVLLIVIFSVTACEYKLEEENFVKIVPPDSTRQFSLNLGDQSDTVYVFMTSSVHYNFNTDGLKVISLKFSMDDKTWERTSAEGTIDISPNNFTEGFHKLTAELYTNSGSGSIADLSNAEGYYVKKEWTVLVQVLNAPNLTMYENISENGFLKITWDKCDQLNFDSYIITLPDYSKHIIADKDSNFFVDTMYVCGEQNYKLTCVVLADKNSISNTEFTVNNVVPEILFEEKGLDSLKVFWKSPKYKCKYYLEEQYFTYTTLLNNSTETSITIAHPGFSTPKFNFSVKPFNSKFSSYDCYASRTFYINKFANFGYPGYSQLINYAYSKTESVLYACSYDSLASFNTNNRMISKVNLGGNSSNKSYISCPTNSSKVGVLHDNKAFIFDNKDLNNPSTVTLPTTFNYINFTDNNKIIFAGYSSSYGTTDKIQILDVASMSFSFSYNFNVNSGRIFSSKDGKYLAYLSGKDSLFMYEIQSNSLSLKFSYYSFGLNQTPFAFNDYDPSKFFVKKYTSNKVEMRNCADNSFVSQVDLTTNSHNINTIIFYNTDPVTGYLFVMNSGFDYLVLDMNNGIVKSDIKSDFYVSAKLYNNKIYTEELRMLNIINKL